MCLWPKDSLLESCVLDSVPLYKSTGVEPCILKWPRQVACGFHLYRPVLAMWGKAGFKKAQFLPGIDLEEILSQNVRADKDLDAFRITIEDSAFVGMDSGQGVHQDQHEVKQDSPGLNHPCQDRLLSQTGHCQYLPQILLHAVPGSQG